MTGGFPARQADVAGDRAIALGEAGQVKHGHTQPVDMRRHAEDRPDRHHAVTADPGHHGAIGTRDFRKRGHGQIDTARDHIELARRSLARGATFDGDKARAQPFDAAEILIADRLVDPPFTPERCFFRFDGDTVRLDPAIAAAFADIGMDEHPLIDIGDLAALAQTATFGGAGLIVNNRGHTGDSAHHLLHLVQGIALMERHAGWEIRRVVPRGIIGHHRDFLHPFGMKLCGDVRRRDAAIEGFAFNGLAAGHRNRTVEQHLVGDVYARGDTGPDRQQPRVEIGAIAEVLEDVIHLHKRRLPDPRRTFAAHVVQRDRVPVGQPCGEAMAPDTAHRHRTLGHAGGSVMRTARAEARHAHQPCRSRSHFGGGHFRFVAAEQALQLCIRVVRQKAAAQRLHHAGRGQFAHLRQQRRTGQIALTREHRAAVRRKVVEHVGQLLFDDRALLLDHHQLIAAIGEGFHAFRLNRPAHTHFIKANPRSLCPGGIKPQRIERLEHVECRLAGGDNPQPAPPATAKQHLVDPVGAGKGLHRFETVVHLLGFGHDRHHAELNV